MWLCVCTIICVVHMRIQQAEEAPRGQTRSDESFQPNGLGRGHVLRICVLTSVPHTHHVGVPSAHSPSPGAPCEEKTVLSVRIRGMLHHSEVQVPVQILTSTSGKAAPHESPICTAPSCTEKQVKEHRTEWLYWRDHRFPLFSPTSEGSLVLPQRSPRSTILMGREKPLLAHGAEGASEPGLWVWGARGVVQGRPSSRAAQPGR